MNQPWYLIGFGALFAAFGGFLVWMGVTHDDADYFTAAGEIIGGLALLALLTGLIALAVEIGVRGARR